jgi:hypothetical protein
MNAVRDLQLRKTSEGNIITMGGSLETPIKGMVEGIPDPEGGKR